MKLCECGCGTIVNKRFVQGHNRKNTKNVKKKSYDKEYIKERFKTKYSINKETGCWEWKGKLIQGYGGFNCCWEGYTKQYPADIIIDKMIETLQGLKGVMNDTDS